MLLIADIYRLQFKEYTIPCVIWIWEEPLGETGGWSGTMKQEHLGKRKQYNGLIHNNSRVVLGNGFMVVRHQLWTDYGLVQWCVYTSPGFSELTDDELCKRAARLFKSTRRKWALDNQFQSIGRHVISPSHGFTKVWCVTWRLMLTNMRTTK